MKISRAPVDQPASRRHSRHVKVRRYVVEELTNIDDIESAAIISMAATLLATHAGSSVCYTK